MKALWALLLAIALSGCNSSFDINPDIGAQVKIVLYGGRPIRLGDTLTAEIPDLNMVQKSTMNVVYEWARISGDTEAVVTNQSSNGANTYTIMSSDLGNSIKVKAVFKYRDSESSSEDVFPVTELSVNNLSDLKNALMSINTSDSVKITADGVFSINEPIAVPASVELEIKGAISIDENVTVLNGGTITVSSGNLIVSSDKIFRIEAGGSFNIASGSSLDLHGTFDFSDDAALMINGTVVCNSNSTVVRLPYNYSGNGKFVFSKGCIVQGLIGTGYKIDNYTYDNTIEYSKSDNNEIFTVNGDIRIIDAWEISGSLEVRGTVSIDPTKDIQGTSIASKIKVGADAAVTGGINSLNLTEGTYYWDGDKWYKPNALAGDDQTHTLARDLTITLDGTGSTGNITAYAWECVSYTADQGAVNAPYTNAAVNALIKNANKATATVALRKAGTYVFRLTITDSNGGPYRDNVTVTVESCTVRKDVTVSFPAFTSGSASLSFAPAYTPAIAGDGFVDGDLTYTLEDDMEHTNKDFPNGVVKADLYTDMDTPVFTQIFKMDGVELGRHSIKAKVVLDLEGESVFESLHDAANDDLLDAIPAVDLQLEKTVTELP